ncbi:type II secretion system F family protein [Methanothermococcus sp. SCGC AD-155-E23]|nr:type II secretion system F family protein [Methanothermococcus sp. SCGC AD-155-E23]
MADIGEIFQRIIKRNVILLRKAGFRKIDENKYLMILLLAVVVPIVMKFIVHLNLRSVTLLIVLYVLSVLMIPKVIYELKIEEFERNLPKALYVMVLSLESGRSIVDAIQEVVDSGIKEVDKVFLKIILLIKERKLSFEEAVYIVANSMDSHIFKLVGRLLIETRKYGGELAETLTTLAKTLEDLQNLRSQLLSVTANGLAVGLVILCGVVPATAGIIGGYLNIISSLLPNATPVKPEEIAKCMEVIQIGTGIFGLLFTIPLFGLKVSRMIIGCALCMTFGMLAFYVTLNMTGILFK